MNIKNIDNVNVFIISFMKFIYSNYTELNIELQLV